MSIEDLILLVQETTSKHLEILQEALENAPGPARKGIERAIEVSVRGGVRGIEALNKIKNSNNGNKVNGGKNFHIISSCNRGGTIEPKGIQFSQGESVGFIITPEGNIIIPLKLHGFHMRGHQEWANNIIHRENIEDQSEWLSIKNEDELIDAYQNSMVCVVPYTGYPGSFPISMALSNALPVIVGDTLGMPEYVNGAGLVFKSKSVEEIASALKKIHGDEALRNEMGNQGRLTAEKLFSWPIVAEQTLAVYKKLYINNN